LNVIVLPMVVLLAMMPARELRAETSNNDEKVDAP